MRKGDKFSTMRQSSFARGREQNENLEEESERAILVSPLKSVEKHKLIR